MVNGMQGIKEDRNGGNIGKVCHKENGIQDNRRGYRGKEENVIHFRRPALLLRKEIDQLRKDKNKA